MKKGDIAIEYIFVIFVSVIAVFVIIALMLKTVPSTQKFLCKLSGTCETPIPPGDIPIINTTDCTDFQHEIIKAARLCFENGKLGRIKQGICYVIMGPCNIEQQTIKQALVAERLNFTISYDMNSKAIISYDYLSKIVKVD